MNRSLTTFTLLTVLAVVPVRAQEGETPAVDRETMEKWMEYMTPGEPHARLEERAGKWNLECTMWMAPGAPPVKTRATSEQKLILGGRFLLDRTVGEFQGQPFEGLGLTGFDNLKKKYVGLWIDNHSTGLMLTEGSFSRGTFRYQGEHPDLETGGSKKIRSVETTLDENTWKMESYEIEKDGSERKSMEIVYRRAG